MAKKNKENSGGFSKFVIILVIITLLSSFFAIYEIFLLSGIETLIRYIVIGVLILIDLIILFKSRGIRKKKKKKSKRVLFIIFDIIYMLICLAVGIVIFYVYGRISGLNKTFVTYTSDLVVMSKSDANKVSDIKDMTIGILDDKTSPEGYIIPQEIIKKNKLNEDNEIKDYDDYTSMLVDLYSGDLDAMFVTNHYVSMFSGISGYENVGTETKIITSKSKKMLKANNSAIETASSGKSITEPFTILLMGIDSTDEVLSENAIANGDTLILITFNPKTLNATMLSIPRDSYVPIACWANKAENKITHAAAYGNDCMIKTIENYFDVNIDYYAKINFKGLVKLVDALGGVEIDVEQTLCTDNSNREEAVCIFPGKQVLDGEHALVYARNRKQLVNGDFGRNYHQQQIIMGLMDKVKDIKDAGTFMNLLNTVSNSIDTNFTTKQILSFYNVAKDILKKSMSSDEADIVNIERLYLQGSSQMIYDERARMVLYNYVPNKNSRKDIIQAMNENLEKAAHTDIKTFGFNINVPFEKEVIGYGPYSSTGTYSLLPDFTGDTEAVTQSWCTKLGIRCSFIGTGGTVVSQSVPANSRIDKINGTVTFTLSQNKTETKKDDKKDDDDDKKKEPEKEEPKEDTGSGGDSQGSGSGSSSSSDNSGSGSESGNTENGE